MNTLQRECPKCNQIITYTSESGAISAKKRSSLCMSCCQKKYTSSKLCLECGKPILRVSTRCKSCSKKGDRNWVRQNGGLKPETIEKLKLIGGGKNHFNYKKNLSEKTKQKISDAHKKSNLTPEQILNYRKGALKRILRQRNIVGKVFSNYNEIACKFFKRINSEFGWEGHHAENVGEYAVTELGYLLDYYEPKKNVIIEWDEPYHKKKSQSKKDKIRQEELVKFFGCKFYRVKEYELDFDLLKKIKSDGEYKLSDVIDISV